MSSAVTFQYISTVLTSTSGLGNYLLSVLTNPSIRLRSVFNQILPHTTVCLVSCTECTQYVGGEVALGSCYFKKKKQGSDRVVMMHIVDGFDVHRAGHRNVFL